MEQVRLTSLLPFLFLSVSGFAQSTISGKVIDTKGNPIIGVSVIPKGAATGTSTDSMGVFTLKTNPLKALVFTAIGYIDTLISIRNDKMVIVVMRQNTSLLSQVTVSPERDQSPPTALSNEIINEENIQYVLADYVKGAGTDRGYIIKGEYTMHTINPGSFLPIFHQPTETKGSRFIMSDWSPGLVVNRFDKIIQNDSYTYNYDKITGDLLMTQNRKTYIDIDRASAKSFALKGANGGYVFEQVPLLDPSAYFEVLGKGDKFALYKSIKTKFVKANGSSNGLTSVGNDYNEYVDQFYYFLIDLKTKEVKKFELNKKSIKAAVGNAGEKTDKYFNDHKDDDIDDRFVTQLVYFLKS